MPSSPARTRRSTRAEPGPPSPGPGVLLVGATPEVVGPVRRCVGAAALGLARGEHPDDPVVREGWVGAELVLVDAAALGDVAAARLPRRAGVLVCTAAPETDAVLRAALDVGAETVLDLTRAEGALLARLADTRDRAALGRQRRAPVVGVVAGVGGAGATVLATAVAEVAARGRDVVLLDADPGGPGIEHVLALDPGDGVLDWSGLRRLTGRVDSGSLVARLPAVPTTGAGTLGVLGFGPEVRDALADDLLGEVVDAAARGADLVVADLPRAAPLPSCDATLLVVPGTVPGVGAAGRLLRDWSGRSPGLVVARRGAGLAPPQVADLLGLELVAELGHERRLDEWVALGAGSVPRRRGRLVTAALDCLDHVLGGREQGW